MNKLDTAANYQQHTAHRSLAHAAGDLIGSFEISTKVGFFPEGHRLAPASLKAAIQQIPEDFGRLPDTVLLHNPETSATGLGRACQTLAEMTDAGYCRAWGISSWSPHKLAIDDSDIPRPDTVLVRAGLSAPAPVLEAAETLASRTGARQVWGMAPFGGSAADPLWSTIDTSLLVPPQQQATPLQRVAAAAFALPAAVERLCVGTSSAAHLSEIVHAEGLSLCPEAIEKYRGLLRRRAERISTA
ncbi:aldo/keto reductase [Streptomonospora litoralis]|uniref:Aldo/keto reductase family protein n=1 Tax=Streptomonospora litoralis TaxID=2498135 RepID=A0A4V0ZK22_9ACTN|nr:aldo/keto reductase [Streptomonospora litoralis]QBI55472.1 Aldo/keto reductase family protein [Streptomonospora litoralis]